MRRSLLLSALLTAVSIGKAQRAPVPTSFAGLVASLPTQPFPYPPELLGQLDDLVQKTDQLTLQQQLPTLLHDAESPRAQLRNLAMLMLFAAESRRQGATAPDINSRAMLVPYIDRLAPGLHDPDPSVGNMTFLILQGLLFVRPMPPELVQLALEELKRPDATHRRPSPDMEALGYPRGTPSKGVESAWGPSMLWILLPAGATFARDPAAGVTEGRDSPEIEAAVIAFVRRQDQTPESLAETIRAISLAQPQSTAINDALLPFLDRDGLARESLLQDLARITLLPTAYQQARTRVQQIAADDQAPPKERRMASDLLGCWTNDRHQPCVIRPN